MKFGMSLRVLERVAVGDVYTQPSLFFHDAVPFAYYDDPNFIPEFALPPRFPIGLEYLQNEMETICSNSIPCQYDYVMTLDPDFAKITKQHEAYAQWLS